MTPAKLAELRARRTSTPSRTSTPRSSSSRKSAEENKKVNITTKRVICRQERKMPKWEGITQGDLYKAGKIEQKIRKAGTRDRQELKKLHCNVFKGRRPPVPSILCVAHKIRKPSKGRDVIVTPDTGATMMVVPWALVQKLRIDVNVNDDSYDLGNTSCFDFAVPVLISPFLF